MDDLKEIWRGSLEKGLSQDHWMSRLFSTKDAEGTAQVSWSSKKHITQVCSKDAFDVGGLASCAVTKLLPQLQTHSSLLCIRMLNPTLLTIFSLCQLLPTRLRLQGVSEGDRWVGELTSHPCECQADAAPRQELVNPFLVSPTVWKIQTAWDAPLCCYTTPVFSVFVIFSAQIQTVLPSTDVQKQPINIPLQLTLKRCKCQSLWHCFSLLSLKG